MTLNPPHGSRVARWIWPRSAARVAMLTGVPHPSPFELPELDALERTIALGAPHLHAGTVCSVDLPGGGAYPVWCVTLGNPSMDVPAVGYFGGVHGLERIGAGVLLAYLHSLVERLACPTAVVSRGVWHGDGSREPGRLRGRARRVVVARL